MKIYFRTFNNSGTFPMEVEDSDTVEHLKFKIQEKHGIWPQEQRLIYGGQDLEDGRTLSYYYIGRDSIIQFSLRLCRGGNPVLGLMKDGTKIFVRKLNGDAITVPVEGSDTVEHLRLKILEKEGIPLEQQRLIYGGQKLEDGRTLSSYDIGRASIVFLAVGFFGGGFPVLPQEDSMEISFTGLMFDKYAVPIKVDGSDVVEVLKFIILEKEGVNPDQQRLIYRGQKLEDGRTLSSYDISQGSTIYLLVRLHVRGDDFPVPHLKNGVEIFVQDQNRKAIRMEVEASCTVGNLMLKILEKWGIPPDDQRLIFCGKQLDRARTLSYYNICHDSTIHFVRSLRGGGEIEIGPRHFVDLENKDALQRIGFVYIKEQCRQWSVVCSGLNIEGKCTDTSCDAYGKRVICRKRFGVFNITSDDVCCPMCYNTIKAITCGFTDCEWIYRGRKKGSDVNITSEWHIADDEYERYREAGNTIDWDVLIIEAKQSPALPRPQCPIYLYDMSPLEEPRSLACGCQFHSDCVASWKIRETHCPTCRAEIRRESPIASPGSRFETNCTSPSPQHSRSLYTGEMSQEGTRPPTKNRFRRLLSRLGVVCN